MKTLTIALVAFLALATAQSSPAKETRDWRPIAASEAVPLAAAAAPNGVPGLFSVFVKATGSRDGHVYLNSEEDYRDQRNLTVDITPAAAAVLAGELRADPLVAYKGKRILVTGEARRVTIHFRVNGKPTDQYYYQTHVQVTDSGQIATEK